MATTKDDIVKSTITIEQSRILRAGFGKPLLVGDNNRTDQRVTVFKTPKEMLDAGYEKTDLLYISANSLMAQEQSPEEFLIGRKKGDSNCLQTITFDAIATSGTFILKFNSSPTTAIAFDADEAAIKAALEALTGISEVTVVGTADAGSFTVEFTGADANTDFALLEVDPTLLVGPTLASVIKTQYGSEAEDYVTALDAIKEENDTWYALSITSKLEADFKAVSVWLETQPRLFFLSSNQADLKTNAGTDFVTYLKNLGYIRTVVQYSDDNLKFPESAWMGGQLPSQAGSTNWNYAKLKGITPDKLSTNDTTNLKAKNINMIEDINSDGARISWEGITISGEYIDIVRLMDWMNARVSENVFSRLIEADIVRATNDGINYLAGGIEDVMIDALNKGLITEYTIIKPDELDLTEDDKLNRILRGLGYTAKLAGAINIVYIEGKVSV